MFFAYLLLVLIHHTRREDTLGENIPALLDGYSVVEGLSVKIRSQLLVLKYETLLAIELISKSLLVKSSVCENV